MQSPKGQSKHTANQFRVQVYVPLSKRRHKKAAPSCSLSIRFIKR
nr:MAG TPA: hypothetical protein [Caudoviricetes sp.]